MPDQTDARSMKDAAKRSWGAFAEQYAKDVTPQLEPLYQVIVDRAGPKPGERVLDIGSGPGRPALDIAKRVAPGGHVTGFDLAPRMVSLARETAGERGLENVEFLEMDMEAMGFPDCCFDLAVSNYALFMRPEVIPSVRRLLKPGGRLVVTAWGDEQAMLAHSLAANVMGKYMPTNSPPPPRDNYALGRKGALAKALRDAGFTRVHTEQASFAYRFSTPGQYADYMWDLLGRSRPPEVQAHVGEIKAELSAAVAPFASRDRVEVPFAAVLGIGYR